MHNKAHFPSDTARNIFECLIRNWIRQTLDIELLTMLMKASRHYRSGASQRGGGGRES
jgi:hypothetical protein